MEKTKTKIVHLQFLCLLREIQRIGILLLFTVIIEKIF